MSWGVVPDGAGCGRARSQPGPVAAGPGRRCTAPRSPRSVEFRVEIGSVPHRDRFRRDRCPPPDRRRPGSCQTGRMRAELSQSGTGAARRAGAPGARPRDSKDRSKALRVAPTRLPRIVNPHPTLRTPPPGQAPKHPRRDASRRRHRSPTNRPRPQENSSTEYFQTPTFECARNSPTRLNTPAGAGCFPTSTGRSSNLPNQRLNAPTGAWCFPTAGTTDACSWRRS